MENLTLKYLAGYLPYDLRIKNANTEMPLTGNYLDELNDPQFGFDNTFKPILRPLSDLTIDFYWINLEDGDCELNKNKIEEIKTTPRGYLKLYQVNYLYKHHFDIHGLIDKNLAIDINTL